MSSASDHSGTEDDRCRRATADTIAMMWSLKVVEAQEALERAVQGGPAGEVGSAKDHAPVLMQDRLLQPLDEAIGPRVPGFGARVANAAGSADLIEGALELVAAVGEHAVEGPARLGKDWQQGVAQERRGGLMRQRRQDGGDPVGAGRIAGRDQVIE